MSCPDTVHYDWIGTINSDDVTLSNTDHTVRLTGCWAAFSASIRHQFTVWSQSLKPSTPWGLLYNYIGVHVHTDEAATSGRPMSQVKCQSSEVTGEMVPPLYATAWTPV